MADQVHITANEDGQKLGRFLRKKFPQIPLSALHRFLRQKKVRIVRGERKFHGKSEDGLERGDTLLLFFDSDRFGSAPVRKTPDYSFLLKSSFFRENFRVHYEDEYFWVAEKRAGIAVHPGTKTPWGRSLIDLFIAHAKSKNPNSPEPKLVHRLDKDTSGLILIAKNDAVLRQLTALLRMGEIEKKYLALIKGKLPKERGEIRLKLLRTGGSKYTKIRVSREAEAKESITHYEVREYFSTLNASLLEVRLETGRMHQIRVHFASLGHPLAGDEAYGDFSWNRELAKKYGLKRHFLHARSLRFEHPVTGKQFEFVSELPEDLRKILPRREGIR